MADPNGMEAASSAPPVAAVPAGWYPDLRAGGLRWWDGAARTDQTSPDISPAEVSAAEEADDRPHAKLADWIGGTLLGVVFPRGGLVAASYYTSKGGRRVRCGWYIAAVSALTYLIRVADLFSNYSAPGTPS